MRRILWALLVLVALVGAAAKAVGVEVPQFLKPLLNVARLSKETTLFLPQMFLDINY